jgi:hypothetical protein
MNQPADPPLTTADESIGRPEEWREGRYQKAGEPLEEMVNDPEQTRAAPEDPVGGQTPPRRSGPLHTDTPSPSGERAVTLDDYTDPKP